MFGERLLMKWVVRTTCQGEDGSSGKLGSTPLGRGNEHLWVQGALMLLEAAKSLQNIHD